MKINSDAIKELAALLEETGLTEIEVSEGEKAIRVAKGTLTPSSAPVSYQGSSMHSDPTMPQAANTAAPDNVAHAHPGAIVSPMVGTVYMQPGPDTPPYVKKGDTVEAGDTLLIIEAMKVMNPIKAEKSGTVTHVMVQNGQPVEYGDVLMVIE
ncbi:MAG: acetyl-CoA carboxylase biotin carboxyl carrier protein [Alphaproteobacteria bacterium]